MPILTVIAGPNGSGKSTLTAKLGNVGISFGEYLNADDIARDLTGEPEWVSREAQQIVRDARNAAMLAGRDHSFETVMSHPSHIDHMVTARQQGFTVRLFFVATEDPVINIDRVANRVVHGGHPVPEQRIVDRYYRCLDHLPFAIRAADQSVIFDNSRPESPMRLLAELHRADPTRQMLVHWVPRHELPVWWLEALVNIKPVRPLDNGLIT